MIPRPANWSRPASAASAVAAGLVAVVLFLVVWGVLHRGFFTHHPIVDTPVYERYGSAMDDGRVPYRDFSVEYPPGALPVFVLPALGDVDSETFRVRFEGLMVSLGEAMLVCVALALLAVGAVVLSRFDLWPAALTAASLAALVAGRGRLGHATLGAAVAAKLYPAVLAPLALVYVWRRAGRREALVCGGILAGVVAAAFAPFVAVAPGGVWDGLWNQASRPLQIESLGSGFLLAAHHAFGTGVTMRSSHGSQNLEGALPDALAVAQSAVQALILVAIWVAFARGPAGRERLVVAAAAALCALVALGKVFSPQFLIWLIPVVPLVRGRRGLYASALLALALVLTQIWFPYRYWALALRFDELPSWLVLGRDLVLIALVAVLWPQQESGKERASDSLLQ